MTEQSAIPVPPRGGASTRPRLPWDDDVRTLRKEVDANRERIERLHAAVHDLVTELEQLRGEIADLRRS